MKTTDHEKAHIYAETETYDGPSWEADRNLRHAYLERDAEVANLQRQLAEAKSKDLFDALEKAEPDSLMRGFLLMRKLIAKVLEERGWTYGEYKGDWFWYPPGEAAEGHCHPMESACWFETVGKDRGVAPSDPLRIVGVERG